MAVTVADDNCLRAGTQHAVRDDDVLARFCPIRNAGKRNAVVAARNMAIGNNNTFTARNMDAIVVRHVEAGVNRKAKQLYTLTRVEAERPARRVDNLNAAHSNILRIVEEDALARARADGVCAFGFLLLCERNTAARYVHHACIIKRCAGKVNGAAAVDSHIVVVTVDKQGTQHPHFIVDKILCRVVVDIRGAL